MPHAFHLTNSRHSLLSCTIHGINLPFHSLPTECLPAHFYIDTLGDPILLHSLHMAEPSENTFINPSPSSCPFVTPHNSVIRAFRTLSILLIPSKPLRFSICTVLILDRSFHYHYQSLKRDTKIIYGKGGFRKD